MSLEKIINGIKKVKSSLKKAVAVGSVALALAGGVREAKAQETDFGYEIIKIEVPGVKQADNSGVSINNLGWVVGNSVSLPDANYARKTAPFLYRDGITELIVPEQFYDIFGNDFSAEVCAVNDEGKMLINAGVKVEGEYHHESYKHDRGFIYNPNNGELIELPFKGVAMNKRGEVVGKRHLLRNGQVIDIGLSPIPGYSQLQIEDLTIHSINDDAQIVGEVIIKDVESGENKNYPFVWEKPAREPDIEIIYMLWYYGEYGWGKPEFVKEPLYGVAYDISNDVNPSELAKWQYIAGWFSYGMIGGDPRYTEYPYFSDFSCMWIGSFPMEIDQLDTNYSRAYAVNDKGQTVGKCFKKIYFYSPYYDHVRYSEPHAVLYQNSKITDLNDFLIIRNRGPFWEYLSEARDINNEGWITGFGSNLPERASFPFIAKPLKEPSPDLNKDGIVNLKDLSELAEHWLEER